MSITFLKCRESRNTYVMKAVHKLRLYVELIVIHSYTLSCNSLKRNFSPEELLQRLGQTQTVNFEFKKPLSTPHSLSMPKV